MHAAKGRHIALVTQGFDTGGGVPSVARWLRDGLREAGHDVDVHDLATSSRDPSSRRIARPASWLQASLRGPSDPASGAQHWGANAVELEPMRYLPRRELTRALRTYDLIQVVAGGAAVAGAVVGAGPPVFLQVATRLRWERRARHGVLPLPARAWGDAMTAWATRLEVRALVAIDGVFVENREMLAYVGEIGQRNVVLAPPGVDTDRFRPAASAWAADGYLLSVCRLAEPRKRLDRLIDGYRELVRRDPSAPDLVLAGRGQLPEDLRRRISAAGVASRVTVRTDVAAADLPELYRCASVYVQASDEEGLGISVLEAMASGLPVVATDTAGARECVVDGSSGLLVQQDDAVDLAAAFAERLTQVLTAAGGAMGDRGRRRCEAEFSSRQTLARFLDSYDRSIPT